MQGHHWMSPGMRDDLKRLFVYGTLAPGEANEHMLNKLAGSWQPASIRARHDQQGWGLTMGYPAIVLDEHADRIDGLVFTSIDLALYWPELDDFEGEAYRRVVARVMLEDGTRTDAYVYELGVRAGADST
jgi:gamma-glutamylcyclotransferase (GGCT)/AIG2-like uncharacterized protein YtfP